MAKGSHEPKPTPIEMPPPRVPTPQELADNLLMRWRVCPGRWRSRRSPSRHGGSAMKGASETGSFFVAAILIFIGITLGAVATDALDDAIIRACIVRGIR
jgi:hypothetical protein